MNSRKWLAIGLVSMMTVVYGPMIAFAGDLTSNSFAISDPMRMFVRPPFRFNECYLGNESGNENNTLLTNLTTTQIDTYQWHTFCVNISDQDLILPNITYIDNVSIVGFVNFAGDPTPNWPTDGNVSNSSYNKRNYQFLLQAERISGGGNESSYWVFNLLYPNPLGGDNEVQMKFANCSAINERDLWKNDAGSIVSGSDGSNDTLELRFAFRLGNQTRATNSSGSYMADNWRFYASAYDTFGIESNSKGLFLQWFDVYMKCGVGGIGKVAGRSAPGYGAFLLNSGPDSCHVVPWFANNNCSFSVNATDFDISWFANSLFFSTWDDEIGSANWTMLGSDFTYVARADHAMNGTSSKSSQGPGENGHGGIFWKCSGVPLGQSSGSYTSTITTKIVIDGT